MLNDLGRFLVVAGLVLVVAGGVLLVAGRIPGLGRLPGDIVIRRGNFTFYAPLATGLVISLVLSLVLTLIARR